MMPEEIVDGTAHAAGAPLPQAKSHAHCAALLAARPSRRRRRRFRRRRRHGGIIRLNAPRIRHATTRQPK